MPGPFVVSFGGVPVYRQENTCSSQPLSSAPAHGLRGEVIVDVRSDDPEVMAPGSRLDIAGDQRSLTVRSVRVHKDRVLASFEECSTREDAEALRGARLLVDAHPGGGCLVPA